MPACKPLHVTSPTTLSKLPSVAWGITWKKSPLLWYGSPFFSRHSRDFLDRAPPSLPFFQRLEKGIDLSPFCQGARGLQLTNPRYGLQQQKWLLKRRRLHTVQDLGIHLFGFFLQAREMAQASTDQKPLMITHAVAVLGFRQLGDLLSGLSRRQLSSLTG
jgi:hypothetical protein